METKPFQVSQDCWNLGLRSGAIVFRDVRISDNCPELREEIAQEARRIRDQFPSMAQVRSRPQVASYRELLARVGVRANKYPPSVESLIHFMLKRSTLPAINSLVDAYNLMSVRTLISMGAHNLDGLALPVQLRLLRGDETFCPLGSNRPQPVRAGEFGYVDGADRVMCRLDVQQADFSKITLQTRSVLLIIEGTAVHLQAELRGAFAECITLIQRYCEATVQEIICPA